MTTIAPWNRSTMKKVAKVKEPERCPDSWWMDPERQQDRSAFYNKASERQPKMQARGVSYWGRE